MTRGVYPGSFDPLTIAHLAIAEAAADARGARSLRPRDLARRARQGAARALAGRRARRRGRARARRRGAWLGAIVTDARLITDIARGYDVVVMGADKWAQVRDPAWYGDDADARDAAVAALPRVLVAPRPGFETDGAELLDGRRRARPRFVDACPVRRTSSRRARSPAAAHRRRQQRDRQPARRVVARPGRRGPAVGRRDASARGPHR